MTYTFIYSLCVIPAEFAFMQRVFAVLTTKPTAESLSVDKPPGYITHRHICEVKQCQV